MSMNKQDEPLYKELGELDLLLQDDSISDSLFASILARIDEINKMLSYPG